MYFPYGQDDYLASEPETNHSQLAILQNKNPGLSGDLAGHSNGGEAAAVAAYFNDLEHLPGNTLFAFDFHFPRLQAENPRFDMSTLAEVIFHADARQEGQVWLDDVGIRTAP